MFKIKASLLFGFIPVESNESWTDSELPCFARRPWRKPRRTKQGPRVPLWVMLHFKRWGTERQMRRRNGWRGYLWTQTSVCATPDQKCPNFPKLIFCIWSDRRTTGSCICSCTWYCLIWARSWRVILGISLWGISAHIHYLQNLLLRK